MNNELLLLILLIITFILMLVFRRRMNFLDVQNKIKDQIIKDCYKTMKKHNLIRFENGVFTNLESENKGDK